MTVRQAVLLAGGRGTRLWPLTDVIPKGLMPVAGIPFLDLQVRLVSAAGVEEVLVAVGRHLLGAWEAWVEGRSGGPTVRLVVEDETLDTAGPVLQVIEELDERFLVLNGDIVLETDLAAFVDAAVPDTLATLCLVEVDDPSSYGVVVVRTDGTVDRFVEKPPLGMQPANTVSAGIYLMSRAALEGRPPGRLSFERVVFPGLVAEGKLGARVVEGRWLDIGLPELYLETNAALLTRPSTLHVPDGHHEHGAGARIDGAMAGGWSWVGPGAVIEAGAVVEESVVLKNAYVAADAVVKRAIIGPGARIESGASVTDGAVVGPGALVGAGCELAHGVRIGTRARLEPGSVSFSAPE